MSFEVSKSVAFVFLGRGVKTRCPVEYLRQANARKETCTRKTYSVTSKAPNLADAKIKFQPHRQPTPIGPQL